MKRFLLFAFLITFLAPFTTQAAHVAGEEIYYKNIGPRTYRVFAVFYATCQSANYSDFYNKPDVIVYAIDSNSLTPVLLPIHLVKYDDGLGDSVNAGAYCSRLADSSNCNTPASQHQGYIRYVYSGTITLPNVSPKWYFEFLSEFQDCTTSATGDYANWNPVDNFVKQPSSPSFNLSMYAFLNNTVAENSSAIYQTRSNYGLYCPSGLNIYTQASTDPDNDALTYNFSQVYFYYPDNACRLAPVSMLQVSPYSFAQPLPGTQILNPNTGELDFNAQGVGGNFLVSFTVSEYRNNALVGTSQRQRIFALDSSFCSQPATGHVDTASADLINVYNIVVDTIYTCAGNPVSFQIPVANANMDTVNVSFQDVITGSSVTVNNNNTSNPNITFNWNTTGADNGVYTLTAYINTKSCPVSSMTLQTFTIIIGDAGTIGDSIMTQTHCLYKAGVRYEVLNKGVPYTIQVLSGATTINNISGTTHYVYDSLAAGTYTLVLHTQGLPCTHQVTFVVPDDGEYPYKPVTGVTPVEYCRDGKDSALVAFLDGGATDLKWYDPTNNIIPAPVLPSTATAGTYLYTVSQVRSTCESAKDTMIVIVDQDPCNFDIDIHNVITPNGDGHNDVWEIDNLKFYPDTRVEVFDKLGDKVYDQEHYSNNWDGGKLPSGVYYYLVDLGKPNIVTGTQKYTGYFMIKR